MNDFNRNCDTKEIMPKNSIVVFQVNSAKENLPRRRPFVFRQLTFLKYPIELIYYEKRY